MRDVVVVGAGPAGIHAASLLAQAGLDVVLFEAQNRVGERAICSGVLGDEAFGRFDLPTHPILADIRCIQAVSPGGRTLEHRTDVPLAQVLDKGEFNRAMAQRAIRAGVEMQLGCWVNSLEVEKHSVAINFRSAWGRVLTLAGPSGSYHYRGEWFSESRAGIGTSPAIPSGPSDGINSSSQR